ncbi:MAG TPA: ROK family protein [Candidatus Saccharimonadales bacterium]|nr:ROK family protein [Candidatus Saccharimonadales bacterium]
MYLGIDIGGTKTLVGCFSDEGVLGEHIKFPTPPDYKTFLAELAQCVDKLSTKNFTCAGVAVPGRIDRSTGVALAFGNLDWENVPIQADIAKVLHYPVIIENDAKLATLSEAALLRGKYRRILYITVSTGIGTGVAQDGILDPALIDAESGSMMLEHDGKLTPWEEFASGKAIVERYGKRASEIQDTATWHAIAKDLALGILELIAVVEPDAIVFGGAVSNYFERFQPWLTQELSTYTTALTPLPALLKAARPDEAVIYGCYELARARYGKTA